MSWFGGVSLHSPTTSCAFSSSLPPPSPPVTEHTAECDAVLPSPGLPGRTLRPQAVVHVTLLALPPLFLQLLLPPTHPHKDTPPPSTLPSPPPLPRILSSPLPRILSPPHPRLLSPPPPEFTPRMVRGYRSTSVPFLLPVICGHAGYLSQAVESWGLH